MFIVVKHGLTARERLRLQLARWRRAPLFGIIENKLLARTFLSSLRTRVAQAPIIYGAFATKSLGGWPKYDPSQLLLALGTQRHFVLKSATNGGGADVLIMTPERWQQEGWTAENVTQYAERFMCHKDPCAFPGVKARWFSEWGQKYEHRGVVVQESIIPMSANGSDLTEDTSLTFEMKANVAFGQVGSARLYVLPKERCDLSQTCTGTCSRARVDSMR